MVTLENKRSSKNANIAFILGKLGGRKLSLISLLSNDWSCFICSSLANPHHEGAAYLMRDIMRDSLGGVILV